ncbi:tagatose 1,6-diphosphate aldolase [Enterococcus sp. AZ103]
MKALTVVDVAKFELTEMATPKPKAQEVLIKVAYVGICGSDLPRYFDGGVHQFPQVLGHEFSGVIEELGSEVKNLKKGDRVAVAPLVPCGKCEDCQSGHPQLCKFYSFIGSRQAGAMAEYVAVPAKNCLVLPDNLSLKIAATIEPLTVAIHGIELVKNNAGARVMVLGAGTIGLMTVLALRARGVGEIIVIDINDHKLEKAKEIGADTLINSLTTDLAEYFKDHPLAEVVFETAGNHLTQVQAIKYAGNEGKVVYVGTCTKPVTFEPEDFEIILRRELMIKGSWMSYSAPFPGFEWHAALRYLATNEVNTEALITGLYQLEDLAIPFEKMTEKNGEDVKVMYEIGGEMSLSKEERLKKTLNQDGIIAALAIDQRGAMKKMIGKIREATTEDIVEFKKLVSSQLTPYTSSILLDPEYGIPAAKQKDPESGLLLAYEKTGYDATVPGRLPDILDDWSVRRLKDAGADACKFLLYYDVDEQPEINDHKMAFIERLGSECRAEELPFFLELVSYDAKGLDPASLEYAKAKPRKVNEMMKEFSAEKYGVDVLKVEVPVNMNYVEGFATGEVAYSKAEASQLFKEQAEATHLPFIFLSAGVSAQLFRDTLVFAKEAGSTFNGVLCGRATWADGVPIFIKDGADAAIEWLQTVGKQNVEELNEVLKKTATPVKI